VSQWCVRGVGPTIGTGRAARSRSGWLGHLGLIAVAACSALVAGGCADAGVETGEASSSDAVSGLDHAAHLGAAVELIVMRCRAVAEHGAGLIIEPGRVLTAAHVVAGATSIRVIGSGRETPGEIIGFDPSQDLAVIAVPTDLGSPVPVPSDPIAGLRGRVGHAVVFRDGQPELREFRIERRVNITTEDVYRAAGHRRIGYEVSGSIETGDSGSVVVVDGSAIAVMWARSRSDPDRIWAADPTRGGGLIAEQLATGSLGDSIDVTRCS
jgi:hypothetical protein